MALPPSFVEGLGILTVHNLNMLYHEPCCPKCCAPCGWLQEIASEGDVLELIVSAAPEPVKGPWLGPNHNEEASNGLRINRDWLASRWFCQSHPVCEATESCKGVTDGVCVTCGMEVEQ